MVGIVLSTVIRKDAVMDTNNTHRVAGEDLTVALSDAVDAVKSGNRITHEQARMLREFGGNQGKIDVIDHRLIAQQAQALGKLYGQAEAAKVQAQRVEPVAEEQVSWADKVFGADGGDEEGGRFW
jgi:hypothetical protein